MDLILDMLLFSKSYFKKFTDKRWPVYAGILFVGFADIFSTTLLARVLDFFSGKQPEIHPAGIFLLVPTALLAGAIDIFVFARPMTDMSKLLKKISLSEADAYIIKIAKVYISAHFIIVPLQILLNYLIPIGSSTPDYVIAIAAYIQIGMILWFSGIISRGINTIFEFDSPQNVAVFFAVFLWNFIWNIVLGTGVGIWLRVLGRI